MIKTFKHKVLEQYFIKNIIKLLDKRDLTKIDRILDRLDAAKATEDMNIPGWNLHELKEIEKVYGVLLCVGIGKLLFVLRMVLLI